jgi:cell division septum initiation protein DivIVA
MANPNIELGRKLGAIISSQKASPAQVPAITIEVDQKQLIDAVKSAVSGAGDVSREAAIVAVKAAAEEIGAGIGGGASLLESAIDMLSQQVKASASSADVARLTQAIISHAQAIKSQGEGLAMIAKAIDVLALAGKATKTVEYDEAGRVSRVRIG